MAILDWFSIVFVGFYLVSTIAVRIKAEGYTIVVVLSSSLFIVICFLKGHVSVAIVSGSVKWVAMAFVKKKTLGPIRKNL